MSVKRQRAILLPLLMSTPIDIEFKDIKFTTSDGMKGKKDILKGISGKFQSGELTAIMGPSGAGKSSLLNILTGFQTTGVSGRITSVTTAMGSDAVKTSNSGIDEYRKESCYILQDDQLSPLFTVQEIMMLSTNLKLGSSLCPRTKQMLVNEILETLGLQQCSKTRCGSLSGGQRKRLSIALELVDNPPVMFLDEPTTGLDSVSTLQCVSMLKSLAREGRTIVCTIHQPCASIYEMFDHVYILADGQCVFQGASTNTIPYLLQLGLQCPKYHNPADFILEVSNGEYGNQKDLLLGLANDPKWRKPQIQIRDSAIIARANMFQESVGYMQNNENKSLILVQTPSEWVRFLILLERCFVQLNRDWTVTYMKILLHFLVGGCFGLIYFGIGNDGSKTITNLGFMFCSLVYVSFTSLMPAVLRFPSELKIVKKEKFNNWYSLKTYYMAYLISSIPIQIIFSLTFVSISYYLTEQPVEWLRFYKFLIVIILMTLTAESLGLILGTCMGPVNGTFIGSVLLASIMLYAGFFSLFTHMSSVMYAVSYLSYMRYGLESITLSMYGFDRPDLPCPDDYCHFRSPKMVLNEIGMNPDRYWIDTAVLLSTLIVLRMAAFFSLRNKISS